MKTFLAIIGLICFGLFLLTIIAIFVVGTGADKSYDYSDEQ